MHDDEPRPDRHSVYGQLHAWARRTTTSVAGFVSSGFDRLPAQPEPSSELIYRLKQWPHLSPAHKTAEVLRTLSVMSSQPVNRRWILSTSGLKARDVDRLLARLDAQGVLEIIDPARFAR